MATRTLWRDEQITVERWIERIDGCWHWSHSGERVHPIIIHQMQEFRRLLPMAEFLAWWDDPHQVTLTIAATRTYQPADRINPPEYDDSYKYVDAIIDGRPVSSHDMVIIMASQMVDDDELSEWRPS